MTTWRVDVLDDAFQEVAQSVSVNGSRQKADRVADALDQRIDTARYSTRVVSSTHAVTYPKKTKKERGDE